MVRLREIMTTNVVAVSPDTTLRDAIDRLAQHHIGGVPVVAGETLVGIVTTNDIISFLSSSSGVPTQRDLDESSLDDDTVTPVGDEIDGIAPDFFTNAWDDAGAEVTTRMTSLDGPEWDWLEEHVVDEAMSRIPLVTLPPSAAVEEAAFLMDEHHIHRVLVTDGPRLVGIVSALDVARAVVNHRLITDVS